MKPTIVTRQLYIEMRPMAEFNNKLWIRVRLRHAHCEYCGQWDGVRPWIPSFHDLYHIVRMIAECEEAKYPQRQGYEGRNMVLRFLTDCLAPDADWDQLQHKYQIPERGIV